MSFRVAYCDREGHTGYVPGVLCADEQELRTTIRSFASKQLDRGALRVVHQARRSIVQWSEWVRDTFEFWGVEQ